MLIQLALGQLHHAAHGPVSFLPLMPPVGSNCTSTHTHSPFRQPLVSVAVPPEPVTPAYHSSNPAWPSKDQNHLAASSRVTSTSAGPTAERLSTLEGSAALVDELGRSPATWTWVWASDRLAAEANSPALSHSSRF